MKLGAHVKVDEPLSPRVTHTVGLFALVLGGSWIVGGMYALFNERPFIGLGVLAIIMGLIVVAFGVFIDGNQHRAARLKKEQEPRA